MNELSYPHNSEAERAVLGACLISREAIETVTEILIPEDFYEPNYRELYELIIGLYNAGKPADLVTVLEEMNRRGVADRLGGMPLIAELTQATTSVLFVGYHAEIVRDYGLRRRMKKAGEKISMISSRAGIEPSELISEAEAEILKATKNMERTSPLSLEELSPSVIKDIDEIYRSGGRRITGYSSGFNDLDKIISGFQPGSLNIIAARPSMGKTALALNIAQFGGEQEKNPCVLFFSLEMSSRQLMHRMYSAGSGVKLSSITDGMMTEEDYYSVKEVWEYLSKRRIYINDGSELSAVDFRTKCLRFKTRHPDLSLVVVDYLQLMSSGNRRNENRQYEVAEISRKMKSVAVELDCPVIALSQLSRETERRVEKKPQLSDLRDSGAIEQDADTVILLYREDYYGETENNDLMDSKVDLRVAKNRNGKTGVCHLTFQRNYTRFVSYAGNL